MDPDVIPFVAICVVVGVCCVAFRRALGRFFFDMSDRLALRPSPRMDERYYAASVSGFGVLVLVVAVALPVAQILS